MKAAVPQDWKARGGFPPDRIISILLLGSGHIMAYPATPAGAFTLLQG